ncbi:MULTISPECIES: copper resistance protein CopC [unclassified Duganella]|uniref:copper resistance protein CopC n=1 Tax=unclassified Duganella TaxID=2636909 RepID=UPI000E3472BF|nr:MULTISPECIES: copper resistance protein CopC [unclassified Duganella]RFP08136.1 copper resistance protein CopC [Duganella sp. BJB475]RFP36183.1 copper resistance protein CopC [Duganella sp. BJB476]
MKTLHTLVATAVVAVATLSAPIAAAHASLKSSSPAANAVLDVAPKEVALTFNEKIEPAFSSIVLTGAAGRVLAGAVSDKVKATVDTGNPAILRLVLPPLPAGAYTVAWAVAGPDGHRRKGEFTFTVK